MNKLLLPIALALCLQPSPAQAQVRLGIELGLPAMPQMVVVAPGIQVVEGFQDEVFFQGGWYWCRRPDGWYRGRSPRARFDFVEPRRVPGGMARMEAGHYRNWHHEQDSGYHRGEGRREERGHGRPEGHDHKQY